MKNLFTKCFFDKKFNIWKVEVVEVGLRGDQVVIDYLYGVDLTTAQNLIIDLRRKYNIIGE